MLPVGFFMALTLHFGNLVYLHLTVSFIQMLKALTPVITMLALFLAQLETPSRRLILSVSLIALGTLLASLGEGALSLAGVAIMLASEVCEAVRLVMTQVLLVGMQFHPIEGLMYLAPACTFWLVLGVAAVEWPRILETGALRLVMDDWMSFAAAAAMGFAVNSLAYVVIQTASSLTLKVLGTVKNAVVVCLGMALYAEQVSSLQGFGYALSMAAFFWYQRIKTAQIRASASLGDSCPLPPLPALRSHSESHLNKNVVVLAMGAPWSARCVGDLGSADHPKQDV